MGNARWWVFWLVAEAKAWVRLRWARLMDWADAVADHDRMEGR